MVRHGTAAYCDGDVIDDGHHWVATGGVPLDALIRGAAQIQLWEDQAGDGRARPPYTSHEVGSARPLAGVR